MTCDHTAGVTVKSEHVYDLNDPGHSGPFYALVVESITCAACGAPFLVGGQPGFEVRLTPMTVAAPAAEAPATVTADDFELA